MIEFPLFHGTSSIYRDKFRLGEPLQPGDFDHQADLLADLRGAVDAAGVRLEFHERLVLDQLSGRMNWSHKGIYLSPSKLTAENYARSNAANGGELLTIVSEIGARLPRKTWNGLLSKYESVAGLRGGGRPLLLELAHVDEHDLAPETEGQTVPELLAMLQSLEGAVREAVAQQSNFCLAREAGRIVSIAEL